MKIAVLEPGAWGTALGILLSRKDDETKVSSSPTERAKRSEGGKENEVFFDFANARVNEVSFWYENKELALKISKFRENERLPGVKISEKIFISPNLEKVIEDTDLIIIASPSFNFRKTLSNLKKYIGDTYVNWAQIPLLGIAKGIEKETLKLPSQIVEEFFGKIPYAHLSGPGFAKEIVRGKKAKEIIASENKLLLEKLKKLFNIKPLEVSTTTDLIGVQLAGALKNGLSIGVSLVETGISNPGNKKIQKKLIQLGLKEMIKIGKAMGAKRETFFGPAGLEDLILTATNPLSRNFQFGKAILLDAEKMRKDIKERKITVEGFDNVFALYKMKKIYELDLPMVDEIYKVIYQKVSPEKTVKNLIGLAKKA